MLTVEDIENRALELAELTAEEAFAIDHFNLSKRVGEFTLMRFAEELFTSIYSDEDAAFKNLFSRVTKDDMTQNFFDYLFQRLGGDSYYSSRKGLPMLIQKNRMLNIDGDLANRFIEHTANTLDKFEEDIKEDYRIYIFDFIKFTCYYIVAGNQAFEQLNNQNAFDD